MVYRENRWTFLEFNEVWIILAEMRMTDNGAADLPGLRQNTRRRQAAITISVAFFYTSRETGRVV
jgi:hypothetical protein